MDQTGMGPVCMVSTHTLVTLTTLVIVSSIVVSSSGVVSSMSVFALREVPAARWWVTGVGASCAVGHPHEASGCRLVGGRTEGVGAGG